MNGVTKWRDTSTYPYEMTKGGYKQFPPTGCLLDSSMFNSDGRKRIQNSKYKLFVARVNVQRLAFNASTLTNIILYWFTNFNQMKVTHNYQKLSLWNVTESVFSVKCILSCKNAPYHAISHKKHIIGYGLCSKYIRCIIMWNKISFKTQKLV